MSIDFNHVVELLLQHTNRTYQDILPTRRKILYSELFAALILCDSSTEVAEALDLTEDIVEKTLSRYLSKEFPKKPKQVKWGNYLLSLIQHKKCSTCREITSIEDYSTDHSTWDSLCRHCKYCKSVMRINFTALNPEYAAKDYAKNKAAYVTRAIKYKTQRTLATPLWADLCKIQEIYVKCPEGYHVDHIVPLQGKDVCGLHVETNLQYLTERANLQKSNKF